MLKGENIINAQDIYLRKFEASDYHDYKKWFEDKELNKHLGPLDEDWLTYVMSDKTGEQFSFTHKQRLIGVAGTCFSDGDHDYQVLTDIAVRPDLRLRGIGMLLLTKLITSVKFERNTSWRAYVSPENKGAIQFFNKAGWHRLEHGLPEDGMMVFSL